MVNKQVVILLLSILLFSIPSIAIASKEAPPVEQFGVGFYEVVIADSSDALSDPRDLEFHPGRVNELWIANRNTDSITIIENTGLESQTSQNRQDSNRNHFLEEVSAISFGSYHPEFDWQWGSAQETANTFCGQATANNFMGPTLWPSSLTHFAMENQNNGNGLLGSHIDMNHESPYGVGIAHDSGNKYWYNDGYYGELVYYDFQIDHDTGQDDHSDGIVRRYADVQLTHAYGIPGHMIMDKDSGILYIADAGADRVLWVNTDDPTYNTQNIMGDSSRMEPLEEYSRITGIEWGVLATGLNRPSGIALDGDQLFVSENGNGQIVAYDLNSNGKGAIRADSIQTSASSIMGLEIGPNGHLYYVDNGQDEVVRIDPYTDDDGDGVVDENDNCPFIPNSSQANHDSDEQGDVCDDDDDNDTILDLSDDCALGNLNWLSSSATDYDMDGCQDISEDLDDDNDGVFDWVDSCATGELAWISSSFSDYDLDGCRDVDEDFDDDNDQICDVDNSNGVWACTPSSAGTDLCIKSPVSFVSTIFSDADQDGCEDSSEDFDDDNDGYSDDDDNCPLDAGSSYLGALAGCVDSDGDGYSDMLDDFPNESTQWSDSDEDGFGDNAGGYQGDNCIFSGGTSSQDRIGCPDLDGDGWSDPDDYWLLISGADAFPNDYTQHSDKDGDGYGDAEAGFQADDCPETQGSSTEDRFGCLDTDGDGWSDSGDAFVNDSTQYVDEDMDGYGDSPLGNFPDGCPQFFGLSSEQRFGCPDLDGDGWDDELDVYREDIRFWSDVDADGHPDQPGTNMTDDCPEIPGTSHKDLIGCLDSDGDGWSDEADAFPMDSTRHLTSKSSPLMHNAIFVSIAIGVLILISLSVVVVRRRNRDSPQIVPVLNPPPTFPAHPVGPLGPPIPPEGLPPGWTHEQWAWYGADYLKYR